jgi:molybdopterin synthase sulfur carrier subunit
MVTVHVPELLRAISGSEPRLQVEGTNVGELIRALESRYPPLRGRITDETGTLRPHVKLFVNGEVAGLSQSVSERDELHILPAISGGEW